jgi:hypothetical protein
VKYAILLLTATVALTSACSKDSSSSTTPTPATRTTETFNGTVPVRGSFSNAFTVSQSGETDVTLTAAAPPSDIAMGLAVGVPDASANCVPITGPMTVTPPGSTPQLTLVTSPGKLCVLVRDVGNATAAVTYTVTVLHP